MEQDSKKKVIAFRVSDDLHRGLKVLAAREGQTIKGMMEQQTEIIVRRGGTLGEQNSAT